MEFVLGVIVGLLVALLIVVTLIFFRRSVENRIEVVGKQIESAGPRPKGFIVEPLTPAEDARQTIIARNKAQGKDTPINDLL